MEKRKIILTVNLVKIVSDFRGDSSAKAKRVRSLVSEVERLKRALEVLTDRKRLC